MSADWVSVCAMLVMAAIGAFNSYIVTRTRLDIAERMSKTDQRIARIEGRLSLAAAE